MTFDWLADLRVERGSVHVLKTGAIVPLDWAFVGDVAKGLAYYGPIRLKAVIARAVRPGPRIWFTPDQPRPWYMVWNAVFWSGAQISASAKGAVAAFYFEDSTTGATPPTPGLACFNGRCTDVSKSHVARTFETVFGYPLLVDPRTWRGVAVEKSEKNGAHDGRIVFCPMEPAPGKVYQRLVDSLDGGQARDLRTPCVDGEPVLVFVKTRPGHDRFANYNTSVALRRPDEVFSVDELETIRRFARAMQLDWGGLDILRDRSDGRLYIVDVNKTDMPPLALSFRDKMRATRRLAGALRRMVRRAVEARAS
ncbi:MAG: hypothetical protein GC203_00155 [Phenylobacterium sp.]|uniref:hypothetical protein n=1 Tax=Phenylobacterium sp. TaxID=1871053 RepID=UPI0025F7E045|nr:hypothetical protein [Phenylobacterium sp.]MBI1196255.1 hypothetical protein [Phenylobacterium sp.]